MFVVTVSESDVFQPFVPFLSPGLGGSLEDRLAARLFTEDRPGTPESMVSSQAGSVVSHDIERDLVYTVGVDEDVTHMEGMLDKWTYQLKKDILVSLTYLNYHTFTDLYLTVLSKP